MRDNAAQKAMDGGKQGQGQFERVAPAAAARPAWLRRLGYYGLALLLVAIGVAIRSLLTRLVGPSLPTYLTFYPVVALAALVGGWGPGLLAILAAAVVADYWLLPPQGLFKFESSVDLVGLAFFCIMGLLVNVVAQLYRRIRTRLEELVLLRTAALEQANEQLQLQAEELQAQTEELQSQTEELAVTNAALRESEQRWATTVASIGDAVMTTDIDGKITFMNPVAEALTGWTRSAASMKPLEDVFRIVNEESRRGVGSPADKALKEGRVVGLANHSLLVRKDGTEIPIDDSAAPIKDKEGNVRGVVLVFRDIIERKKAEEAQRRQAQLLHLSYDAIIVWRKDGAIEHWNRGAEQLYGFTEREALGRVTHKLLKTVHPVPLPEIEAAMRQDGQWEGELCHCAKDGHEVTVSARHQLVRGADGVERILETNRDITDRKRAQEALRQSERRFHQLFEEDLTGDFLCTCEGRILLCNAAFADIFEFSSADAAVGRSMLELYIDVGERDSILTALREQGKLASYEAWRKRCDGALIHVVENLVGHFDDQGELYEIQGYVFDDTERKQAEEALRQNEERFRQLAENIEEVFFLVTPDWNEVLYISPAYEKVWGRSCQSLYDSARSWLEAIVEEDRSAAVASMEQGVAGVLPKTFPEYRILRPDGTQRWILARCWPIFDSQGNIYRAAGIAEDTTERKQAEEALHTLNATLERKVAQRTEELEHRARQLQKLTLELTQAEERERARIAEILHDDLQQVLAAAKFQMSFLRSRVKGNAEVQEIAGQTRDMLVEAIAKSRNLSHELSSPALTQTNLCAAFGWLAEQMQTMHGFTIHLEMADPLGVPSEALRMLLYKAAQELLFNAIKHAGVAEAKLRLRRQRRGFRLSVSDRGRGIDPTDPAYKPGFGLLSIRERVELLGGRLTIRSAPGKGSTFSVAIPDHEAGEAVP